MNIGQLMRSVLGEVQQTEVKQLELKAGEIVKGMVLQLLAESEALVNIGGVHVKAKLETPLKQGQVTMLQVQPETEAGLVVLKPLESSQTPIAEQSLGDLMKNIGLKDQPLNRTIVQQMHQEGVSLTKENAQLFKPLAEWTPRGAQPEQWVQAAMLALKRGLPITKETVSALHQAVFGKPMNELADELQTHVSAFLQTASAGTNGQTVARAPLQQLQSLLNQLASLGGELLANAEDGAAPMPPQATVNRGSGVEPQLRFQNAGAGSTAAETAAASDTAADKGQPAAISGRASTLGQEPSRAGRLAGTAIQAESEPAASGRQAANGAVAREGSVAAEHTAADVDKAPRPSQTDSHKQQGVEGRGPKGAADGTDGPRTKADSGDHIIARMLKTLGVDHEQRLLKAVGGGDHSPAAGTAANSGQDAVPADVAKSTADSMKSVLLQLATSDELPPALKESVQHMLQQVTGQQLLMVGDRGSMFSHLTLFIPFHDGNGQHTASVHIQSRKKKRGEIDSDNCRLLFDLKMNELGDTLVDVQVVNRIVSLQVHNDHPLLAGLLEMSRSDITAALHGIGYQFLSMKCVAFPERDKQMTGDELGGLRAANLGQSPASLFSSKPYRGVDVRI